MGVCTVYVYHIYYILFAPLTCTHPSHNVCVEVLSGGAHSGSAAAEEENRQAILDSAK